VHYSKPLDCCLPGPDRHALTHLVSSLAFHPLLMAVDYRRRIVGDQHAHTECTVCGRLRMLCVGGCDLVQVVSWQVPYAT
jgi:hypothetical protein